VHLFRSREDAERELRWLRHRENYYGHQQHYRLVHYIAKETP
jgi:hypothetical protein